MTPSKFKALNLLKVKQIDNQDYENDNNSVRKRIINKYHDSRLGYLRYLIKLRVFKIALLRLSYKILDFQILQLKQPYYSLKPKIIINEATIDNLKIRMFEAAKNDYESKYYQNSQKISKIGRKGNLIFEK